MLNFSKYKYLKTILSILMLIFFIISLISTFVYPYKKGYSLFVEFDNAYGLQEGTSVNYKGVRVGVVSRISLNVNKVVVLLNIKSASTLIPLNSIFEANQIGLFNDIVVSITPQNNSVCKKFCNALLKTKSSCSIPHDSYIKGYKGISYDDLVRSTTRISQRFDDPRFFSLFYLFLKNSIYISDEILLLIYNSSTLLHLAMESTILVVSQYLF